MESRHEVCFSCSLSQVSQKVLTLSDQKQGVYANLGTKLVPQVPVRKEKDLKKKGHNKKADQDGSKHKVRSALFDGSHQGGLKRRDYRGV